MDKDDSMKLLEASLEVSVIPDLIGDPNLIFLDSRLRGNDDDYAASCEELLAEASILKRD